MANVTKHNDIKRGPGGRFECAHLIIPRYATAPPITDITKNGEMWYDITNNKLKINIDGTVKEINTDA